MFQEIKDPIGLALSSSTLNLTLVLGTISILAWWGWKRKQAYYFLDSLPCPPRHWLLGNIPQVRAAVKGKKIFKLMFDWAQQLGPIYILWIGNRPTLVLSNPTVIENTITNGMKDGSLVRSEILRKAWNDLNRRPIMLGQDGAEWQWRRKAWNPEFSSTSLGKYFEMISQACNQVITTLKEATPQTKVQVDPLFVELTMRVICGLMLGIPVDRNSDSPEGPPLEIRKTYEAMSVISYRFLRVATGEKRWMKYLPTQAARDYWAALRYFEQFLKPRVDLALQLRDRAQLESDQIGPLFRESMLVKIAAKAPEYTQETLLAEAIELLLAGTDTTAHTLSFAVGELALNSEVFHQAQAIVDQAWETHGGLNLNSLKSLNYIRAIVKETLRLYSVASGSTGLEAARETTIAGIAVPRGTRVSWSMQAAGRDSGIYPRSDEFLPQRWLEEQQGSALPPMIDFGSGYHRCLGEHLAMLEATVMLAMLLRYFTWELVNGRASLEELQQNLLIYPCDGMPLKLKLRA